MRWSVLVLLAGCVSRHSLTVTVTSGAGAPLADAVVGCVCEPAGDAGAVTGPDGVAQVVVFNADPSSCQVTVARPGYRTAQLVVEGFAPLAVALEAL